MEFSDTIVLSGDSNANHINMKLRVVTLLLFIGVVLCELTAQEYKLRFDKFLKEYNKQYSTNEEYLQRFNNFKATVEFIEQHNANPDNTYSVGINQFADWTREEILGTPSYKPATDSMNTKSGVDISGPVPDSWDWRQHNAVTSIKNQQQCGSSPYFSAVTSVEGCFAIATNRLESLSAQQIVDCSEDLGNAGCNGGEMTTSFQSIMEYGGIDSEACYPYKAEEDNCTFNPKPPCCVATIQNFTNVISGNETDLKLAVYKTPVATAVDHSHNGFIYYQSGVYTSTSCSSVFLDHGIGVVGYGHDATSKLDYWILKNSWGNGWGMKGYMYIARNHNNMCGVATQASYAVGCGTCGTN